MKKIISSFLSALLVILCLSANSQTYSNFSLSVSAVAIDSRIESAVIWAVSIAEDDTRHGYCQENRDGPDYDCSSLVAYALKNAGIYDGYAFNTYTMKDILPKYGFKYYYGTSNIQRGDILLRNGHTEIYLGNNQTVGAHINELNEIVGGKTGDQTGNEISVSTNSGNWEGFFRYEQSNGLVSNAGIYTDKSMYHIGEEITFHFHVNNATEIYIPIDYNGKRSDFIDVSNMTDFTCQFEKTGTYGFFLYAKNSDGDISTVDNYKELYVYDDIPKNLRISNNKNEYELGEDILFKFEASNAEELSIPIDYNGKRSDFINVNNQTTLRCNFDKPGVYGYFLYAKNHYGDASTVNEYNQFVIYNQPPQSLKISNNKIAYKKGEVVKFDFKAQYAKELYIPLDYNGKRKDFINVSDSTTYSCIFEDVGVYGYFLYGKNKFGETSTVDNYQEFVIYDEGDVNLDGNFDITDVVLLEKWLLHNNEIELSCWQAADLCEDGKLNTFDLCSIKQKLITR